MWKKFNGLHYSERPPYIKPTKLSNEDAPYFDKDLRSVQNVALKLLEEYPMKPARTSIAEQSRPAAINALLANIHTGMEITVPNFSRSIIGKDGYSRRTMFSVLEHLERNQLITREGKRNNRSLIKYSPEILKFIPDTIISWPKSSVMMRLKDEGEDLIRVANTEVRKLGERLETIWRFYLDHQIENGITREVFELFNRVNTDIKNKEELIYPKPTDILPYFVFNDDKFSKGGRMYGAFWIGSKKILRRAIRIDGDLTCDIDGKGMHVQLLYRDRNFTMPKGDPYLFGVHDKRRRVAKGAMLLMMNTRITHIARNDGRKAVLGTYKKEFTTDFLETLDGIEKNFLDIVLKLEAQHHKIADRLYQPNWGFLQQTEGAIMLDIMERGMNDDIVILPVHDGCLCARQYRDRVLGYFNELGIVAEENIEHLKPLPVEEAKQYLKAHFIFEDAC